MADRWSLASVTTVTTRRPSPLHYRQDICHRAPSAPVVVQIDSQKDTGRVCQNEHLFATAITGLSNEANFRESQDGRSASVASTWTSRALRLTFLKGGRLLPGARSGRCPSGPLDVPLGLTRILQEPNCSVQPATWPTRQYSIPVRIRMDDQHLTDSNPRLHNRSRALWNGH